MPVLSLSASAFVDMAQAHAELFRPLVKEGWRGQEAGSFSAQAPSPFEKAFCQCGEQLQPVAQFWLHERLWRHDFCFHCQDSHWDGKLRSVPASADLPAGSMVQGVTLQPGEKLFYFPETGDSRWERALQETGLAPCLDIEDEEDFWEALASQLGCINSSPDRSYQTYFGGVPGWIQFEETFACSCCQKPMEFLGQLDERGGFCWGDCGVAYLFYCPDHPEQTACAAQMC